MRKARETSSGSRSRKKGRATVVPVQVDSSGRRYIDPDAFLKNKRIRKVLQQTEQIPIAGTNAPQE